MTDIVRYCTPDRWLKYDVAALIGPLTEAKAAVLSLTTVPYQRAWADKLQEVQLKHEVAGTSKIEGADFTENELNTALNDDADESGMTRSQRQARAAVQTYRWISQLDPRRPIDVDLILEIHRRIVTGCDDDHCEPGVLRRDGQNVTFGRPRHRGADGGAVVSREFSSLVDALSREFTEHDLLIRALAFHYYIGAMHPFLDGNGRTARAVEALLLQRAGLRDGLFIALSNYYYDEKPEYLRSLASVASKEGDITEFLSFGLRGVAFQARRLLNEINRNIRKSLFRDVSTHLFNRLSSSRRRVIAKRQMMILNYLLDRGEVFVWEGFDHMSHNYSDVSGPQSAYIRDIVALQTLKAIKLMRREGASDVSMDVRLEWPTEITETAFFEGTKTLPKAKSLSFLERDYSDAGDGVSEIAL
ncbi:MULTISPECIES: Fic family protein [unclassified Brevundimonas]|uniref:Fic family protein n=1 Tax=unclassified Brevundimonas TaxID=2622653 RepID=UPI0025C67E45|nr:MULTISPECIES: Fic family protein [unclassified Brevundimonas]